MDTRGQILGDEEPSPDIHELLDGFGPAAEVRALEIFKSNGWTESMLVDAYLRLRHEWRERDASRTVPSLESQSRRKMIELLMNDADFKENLESITRTLHDKPQLTHLLEDKQMPYKLLRKILPFVD